MCSGFFPPAEAEPRGAQKVWMCQSVAAETSDKPVQVFRPTPAGKSSSSSVQDFKKVRVEKNR